MTEFTEYYVIRSLDGMGNVAVRRAEAPPKIVSGGARWKTVNRPKRTSVVLYDGLDPYRMDLPVLFDGWMDEATVESDIARLNQMHYVQAEHSSPTRVQIDGAVPVKGATWIVEGLDWGDAVIWKMVGDKGKRFRQDAVLHLLQYIPEQALKLGKFKVSDKLVTVKDGQTTKHLANGDHKKERAIKKANGIRDGKTIKAGDRVRVPKHFI